MSITALIDKLGIVADENLDLDNTPLTIVTNTTRVERNQWIKSRETVTVNGRNHTFVIRYRLVEPALTSIQFRETNTSDYSGREDFSSTIVSKRDLQLFIGDDWVDVEDVLLSIYDALGGGGHSAEKLRTRLAGYGLDMKAVNPMYLQQLGASRVKYDGIVEQFIKLGAQQARPRTSAESTKTKVVSHYRLNGGGISVSYLELGTADRSMSKAAIPSGFVGFLDATMNVFNTIITLEGTRSALERESSEEAMIALNKLEQMFASPIESRPFRNWGGLSISQDMLTDEVRYYPQQIPCGRLGVVVDGETVTWDVWAERRDTQVATPAPADAPPENLASILGIDVNTSEDPFPSTPRGE